MKLTKAYLQRMINEEISLHEKAVTKTAAQREGLALFIGRGRNSTKTYMLYDPVAFVQKFGKKNTHAADADEYETSKSVYAMLTVTKPEGPSWGASEVAAVAARNGYGPLIYNIVMAREGGLIPDRHSVSPAATKVWSYYKNKRKDVQAKLIDDIRNPKTKIKKDDGHLFNSWDGNQNNYDAPEDDPRNYAYFASKKPSIDKLIKNHQWVIDTLKYQGVRGNFIDLMIHTSEVFFGQKYGG